ncbi:immune-associated nucleotide-binding protein 9-like [Lotus japonicus]|uniref:immune-associated nucleotide-binding protein 9-like n=1 Tax=Lotus japonicus TaxID=34305 RepID=UPI0025834E37|nr:immune-associated nucleotide-binding protein 9-like [Lotus japonicus]
MGGNSFDEDWELTSSANEVRTVVLVGRTGNGKSATGNSILGKKVFKSRASSVGVTSSCESHTIELDGQTVNVIDTPGLFDISAGSDFVGKEIVNCINLAKDGIHAIIVVFSVRTRFSQEEATALRSLQTLFGDKIYDYTVVVFTGGDELEEEDQTLEDYLGCDCPEPLKDLLSLCENRRLLFDNKTKDERKRSEQVQQLFSFVNMVLSQNGGRPYTDDLFAELKKGALKLHNQQSQVNSLEGHSNKEILEYKKQAKQAYDDQLKRIAEMVESKLRDATLRLEQQLAKEQAARLKAEENANLARVRSDKEIRELRKHLERAHEELRKHGENRCGIL